MPFSTVFQLYHSGQCTYPCFPGVLLTSTPHDILSNIVETTNSGEKEMNPVPMTIITPWKEHYLSQGLNQRPPLLKSATN